MDEIDLQNLVTLFANNEKIKVSLIIGVKKVIICFNDYELPIEVKEHE